MTPARRLEAALKTINDRDTLRHIAVVASVDPVRAADAAEAAATRVRISKLKRGLRRAEHTGATIAAARYAGQIRALEARIEWLER